MQKSCFSPSEYICIACKIVIKSCIFVSRGMAHKYFGMVSYFSVYVWSWEVFSFRTQMLDIFSYSSLFLTNSHGPIISFLMFFSWAETSVYMWNLLKKGSIGKTYVGPKLWEEGNQICSEKSSENRFYRSTFWILLYVLTKASRVSWDASE